MEAGTQMGCWGEQTGGCTSSGLHEATDVCTVALIVL